MEGDRLRVFQDTQSKIHWRSWMRPSLSKQKGLWDLEISKFSSTLCFIVLCEKWEAQVGTYLSPAQVASQSQYERKISLACGKL